MRQPYLVAGALLISLCWGASAVNAQEEPGRIPGSALGAQGALSEKDQKTVTDTIDYWIKQLTSGECERSATARGKLVEPYNQGGTETFTAYYDQILASRIGEGLAAKDICGRLNTMIVARAVRHAKIADVIKAGLKDDVTAIVYQSAVAAEAFTGSKAGELAPKLALRATLVDAMNKEENGFVLEPLYQALSNIPDLVGWQAGMDKIFKRIAIFVANPKANFDAEAAGLRAFTNAIITAQTAGQKLPPKLIHSLLLNSVRYMDWMVTIPWPHSDSMKAFLTSCENAANWAVTTSSATPPANSVAKAKTNPEQQLFMLDWKKLLKADPFKFKDEEINLPKAP